MLYFKIHPPKKTVVIFNSKQDLIFLVSKIIKKPKLWNLNIFIKYDNETVLNTIKQHDAIFFTNIPKQNRIQLLQFCYKHNKPAYVYPDITDILLYTSNKYMVDDSTFFELNNTQTNIEHLLFKRILDIGFSLIFGIEISLYL